MNRLRTYIIRIAVIAAISVGFSLYSVQQIQADHSSQAFASWLTSMVKSADDGGALQKELDDLRESTTHLDEFIKEASYLIKSNNESFEFSFADAAASSHLYQLLLIEWNQFQTGNAMAGIPVPSVTKAFLSVVLDQKVAFGAVSLMPAPIRYGWTGKKIVADDYHFISMALEPMEEGIAIGAP